MKPRSYVGYHAISGILRAKGASGTLYLHGQSSKLTDLRRLAAAADIAVQEVDQRRIQQLGGPQARGAVLIANVSAASRSGLNEALADSGSRESLVLVLDHITDPQNLGAILRSADQFEVGFVVIPERRSVGGSETVMRASAGAAVAVRLVEVPNLVRTLERLKQAGYWIYGADMAGRPVDGESLQGRVALVLGSEGAGLSRLVKERCDVLVRVPSGGSVDSLNVSVSAGILLYEITRQQGKFR